MATIREAVSTMKFVDVELLGRAFDRLEAKSGQPRNPTATAAHARELMRSDGIVAANNEFSRDIIRVREEASE